MEISRGIKIYIGEHEILINSGTIIEVFEQPNSYILEVIHAETDERSMLELEKTYTIQFGSNIFWNEKKDYVLVRDGTDAVYVNRIQNRFYG